MITNKKYYSAYGLFFENQNVEFIKLPFVELDAVDIPCSDVIVKCGSVPERLENIHSERELWSAFPGQFLFRDDSVARILVKDGQEIIIQPSLGADARDISVYLTGSVSAAILLQRGIIPMHASAVIIDGKAVLFTGTSGAGKSVMLAEMLRRGFTALADDLSAIQLDINGNLKVAPAYPGNRLWKDALNSMGRSQDARQEFRLNHQLEKYVLPVTKFGDHPVPLGAIFVLPGDGGGGFGIDWCHSKSSSTEGLHVIRLLRRGTYRRRLIKPLGAQSAQFRVFTKIINASIPIQLLNRKGNGFCVSDMADEVEIQLKQLGNI